MVTPRPLSGPQLEVMNAVWERDEVTIGEVWQELSAGRKIARATVQTVMSRLESKGWLKHRRIGHMLVYSAARPREETQRRMVADLVDSAFDGAADGLVWALIKGRGIQDDEIQRIQEMITEADRRPTKSAKPKKRRKR